LIKGVNDNEIVDFIEWTKALPIKVRFIEFMPFDGNEWDTSKVVTYNAILDTVQDAYLFSDIQPIKGEKNDT
jgi:cyclic pyranopterin phosphate synthase